MGFRHVRDQPQKGIGRVTPPRRLERGTRCHRVHPAGASVAEQPRPGGQLHGKFRASAVVEPEYEREGCPLGAPVTQSN